jgi:hypothetical protein
MKVLAVNVHWTVYTHKQPLTHFIDGVLSIKDVLLAQRCVAATIPFSSYNIYCRPLLFDRRTTLTVPASHHRVYGADFLPSHN